MKSTVAPILKFSTFYIVNILNIDVCCCWLKLYLTLNKQPMFEWTHVLIQGCIMFHIYGSLSGTVAMWVSLSPNSKIDWSLIHRWGYSGSFCADFKCLCGFPLGALFSSDSPNICSKLHKPVYFSAAPKPRYIMRAVSGSASCIKTMPNQ